jgi:hypothetical protein
MFAQAGMPVHYTITYMNWSLLLPSTRNPAAAWKALSSDSSSIASQALSDLFILVTLYLAALFVVWGFGAMLRSLWKTQVYLRRLRGVKDYRSVRQMLNSDNQPTLFRDLDRHLITKPCLDGSEQKELRRSVDAAEIFADETLGPGLSSSRLFQMLPGTLTGLGVLGTFVGLQLGIGGLNLTDLQKLEGSIVPLIQGCAVAFSTSVWGVVTSLGFSFIEKVLEGIALWRVRKLQFRIDSLIPRYVPEEAMAGLELTSRGTENILKGLAVQIGSQMQIAVREGIAELLRQEIASASTKVVDAIREAFGSHAEGIGKDSAKVVAEALGSELKKISEGVRLLSDAAKHLSDGATANSTAVMDAVGRLNAHEGVMSQMAGAAVNVKLAADAFASMKGTLDSASIRNEEAAKAQHSAAEANQQVATKFQGVGEKLPELRQTIEDAVKVIGSLGGPILKLEKLLAQLPQEQEQNENKRTATENERSTRLLTMSKDLAESVGKAATEFAKVSGLADKLSAAATSLEGASSELAVFGEQVVTASKDQRSASTTSLTAAELNKLVAKSLEPLPRAITDLTSGLQAAGSSVKGGAEAARDSYRELVKLQAEWFKGAEVGFTALKDRIQAIIKAYGSDIDQETHRLMEKWTSEVTNCLDGWGNQTQQIEDGIQDLQDAISKIKRS